MNTFRTSLAVSEPPQCKLSSQWLVQWPYLLMEMMFFHTKSESKIVRTTHKLRGNPVLYRSKIGCTSLLPNTKQSCYLMGSLATGVCHGYQWAEHKSLHKTHQDNTARTEMFVLLDLSQKEILHCPSSFTICVWVCVSFFFFFLNTVVTFVASSCAIISLHLCGRYSDSG